MQYSVVKLGKSWANWEELMLLPTPLQLMLLSLALQGLCVLIALKTCVDLYFFLILAVSKYLKILDQHSPQGEPYYSKYYHVRQQYGK